MEEVASTRSDPVALLVVHGIGSQEAGETIEGLVNGLRKIYGQSMNVDWLNKKHARIGGIGRPVHLVEVFWADLLKGDIVKGSFNFDRIFEILWFPILNHRSGCLPTEHYSRRHVLGRTVALVTLGPLLNAGLVGARFLMIPIETVAIFWKELKLPLNERRAARQLRKSGKNFFQAARAIADERALEHYLIDDVMDQVVGDVFNFVMGTAKAFEEETEQTRLITANTAMIQRRFSEAAMEATAQGCGEVQVLSHSLGTLVAYLSMSPRTQQNNGSAKPAKLTKFYTIGSPLEKVRFFWSRLVENDHCGPTIVGNEGVVAVPGDQMSWDNFFSESDLVSGRLKSFRGWPTPKNRPVSGLGGLISSHVAYNSNSGFLEILCEELTGQKPDSQAPRLSLWRRIRASLENLALPLLLLMVSATGLLLFVLMAWFAGWLYSRVFVWVGLHGIALWVGWIGAAVLMFALLVLGVLTGKWAATRQHAKFWGPD